MKKIILTIFLVIVTVSCNAQSIIIPLLECNKQYDHINPAYYLKDTTNEMDKYTGTWEWTQGSRIFTITLMKQKNLINDFGNSNYYRDRLVGYYKYWENGVLIADTSSEDLTQDYGISVHFTLNCHNHITSIAFKDYKKFKDFDVMLTSLSSTQIKMKMEGMEHVIMIINGMQSPPNAPLPGSTFPMEMVLTKK